LVALKLLFFILVFSFSPVLVFAEEQTISVDFGKLYDIMYNAKDVTVFEVIPNSDDGELIFVIDVTSPIATLELTIPRELLDSKENGNDVDFFIIGDGADVTFSEKEATDTSRTLFMQLSPGTTELEVFGTRLGDSVSENESAVEEPKEEPTKEIPQEATEEPQIVEQTPDESAPKEESPKEEVTPVTEEKPSQTIQNIFDFSKMPNWSIPINERQMQQFAMTAGAFAALVIVLIIFKGLRTEQSLP
jgi:hypothetical protein